MRSCPGTHTYLYAGFVAKDPDIFSEFKADSTLWKQDCIEVYLDPGVTHRDYVELKFSRQVRFSTLILPPVAGLIGPRGVTPHALGYEGWN